MEPPLLRRVDTQGIQIGPVAPDPTGCARAARAFDLDSAGRERDGDLSVREGGHGPRPVGALHTAGDMGDRARGVGTGGLLTIAAKDLAGAGLNWLGR